MSEVTRKVPILRVNEQGVSAIKDTVVREHSVAIILNDRELVTLLCSPASLEYLVAGYLLSEGLVTSRDDIIAIKVTGNKQRSTARVKIKGPARIAHYAATGRQIASSGGRGISSAASAEPENQIKIESKVTISDREIIVLVEKFQQCSPVFSATGGVHSAALCNTGDIIVFSDDIGRHNAIDRVFGECLLKGIPTSDRLMVTSGRVSSEILLKVARQNVPIIISVAAPTDRAVELASRFGITLTGFVRGDRMNIYTHEWRITTQEKQK